MPDRLLAIDREYDARRAAPGPSRYGNYLALHAADIARDIQEGWGTPSWVASVYRVARPPILSPGYVELAHPSLLGCEVESGEDADLVAHLRFAVQTPTVAPLPHTTYGWRSSTLRGVEHPDVYPSSPSTVRRTTALTETVVSFPLDLTIAAEWATADPDRLPEASRVVMDDVVTQINALGAPFIVALDLVARDAHLS